MVSVFHDAGLSAGVVANAYLSIAFTAAIVSFIGGFMVDRFPVRFACSAALVGQTSRLLLAPSPK